MGIMNLKTRLVIIALSVSACGIATAQDKTDQLRQQLLTGRAAVEDGFFETARTALKAFLTEGTERPAAERAEAAQLYLRALSGETKFNELLLLLDEQPAWLADNPRGLHRFWRAFALHRTGKNEEAATLLQGFDERSMSTVLRPRALRLLATCMLALGNTQEAGRLFSAFDAQYGESEAGGDNLLDLARLLISEGNVALATDVLSRLLKTQRDADLLNEARYWLGRSYAAQGQLSNATNVLTFVTQDEILHGNLATECWYALGGAQLGLRLPDNAVESFTKGIERSRDAALTRRGKRLLGTVHVQEKNFDEGIRILREVVQEKPDDEDASRIQLLISQALSSQGDYKKALDEFQHYLESFPKAQERADALLGKGNALTLLKRHVEAAISYEKAYDVLTVDDDKVSALFLVGQAYLNDGQFHRAQDAFLALRRDHPDTPVIPNAMFDLARSYMLADELEDAEKTFRAITRNFPSHELAPEALLQVAEMKWSAGLLPESMAAFTSSIEVYTNSSTTRRAQMGRGLVRYQSGTFKAALSDFEKVRRVAGDHADSEQALYLIGLCHYGLGNEDVAVQTEQLFVTTHTNSPYTPKAQYWLAKYAFNQGNFADAESHFVNYFESYPTSAKAEDALFWAGRSAVRQKEYIRAVERLGDVVKAFPEGPRLPEARFEQGNALCELAKFSEAILLFQEIINKHPDTDLIAETWLRVGDCQFMLGPEDPERYDQAIQAFRNCAQSASSQIETSLHARYKIGRCLEKQGDVLVAVDHYYREVMIPFLDALAKDEAISEDARVWFWRSAREAAAVFEDRGEWRKAVSILERVVGVGVSGEAVVLKRIKEIKTKHWWEFY
jgi:TolA-binding protein